MQTTLGICKARFSIYERRNSKNPDSNNENIKGTVKNLDSNNENIKRISISPEELFKFAMSDEAKILFLMP